MKYRISDVHDYGDKKVTLYRTEVPNGVGELAIDLVHHFGLVAGRDDGEDSVGRRAVKLLEPEEVVDRAFAIAELTFKALNARGLMVSLPDLNEINAAEDAKRAAKAQKETA